jgi:hypothetical protein
VINMPNIRFMIGSNVPAAMAATKATITRIHLL